MCVSVSVSVRARARARACACACLSVPVFVFVCACMSVFCSVFVFAIKNNFCPVTLVGSRTCTLPCSRALALLHALTLLLSHSHALSFAFLLVRSLDCLVSRFSHFSCFFCALVHSHALTVKLLLSLHPLTRLLSRTPTLSQGPWITPSLSRNLNVFLSHSLARCLPHSLSRSLTLSLTHFHLNWM